MNSYLSACNTYKNIAWGVVWYKICGFWLFLVRFCKNYGILSFYTPYCEFFYMFALYLYGYFVNFCYICTGYGGLIEDFRLFSAKLALGCLWFE